MNANELADILQQSDFLAMDFAEDAATMLRQQQAEIEALKAAKIRAYNNGVEDGRKPDTNNKPVAWTDGKGNYFDKNSFFPVDDLIPLYTHPVKEKHFEDEPQAEELHEIMQSNAELTDEEIKAVYGEYFDVENCDWLHLECIRAILRKAQEK